MSCVLSEVVLTGSNGTATVTLTREWLQWNEKSNCVYMLRDSREDHAERFVNLSEAEKAFAEARH